MFASHPASEEASSIEGDLSFSNQDLVDRVRRSLATTLDKAAIWVDYASISQANDEDLARGVASLPYYIENSSLFLAVVPPALHADLRVCCDRRSYADRGWCRFELLSPKSPAQQMVRRASSGLSSLGTAARTSAGSFSKFRRAMSMRSTESPLSGGGE